MHSYIKVLALVALGAGLYSCAQEQTVSDRVIEDRIIQAYVEQNHITTKPSETGLYVNVLKEGTGATPAITDWVMVRFTGETLEGDYFHTTDTTVFNHLDYNVNYFHIVPDFLYMAGAMPQGFREALLKMKEGGKVDLLIPSYLGFGSYGAVKFGQMPLLPNAYVQANRPVKYEMELVKVVPKPTVYDSLMVDTYVKNNTGYVDIKDKNVYLKETKKGSTALADTIGKGSKVYVFYAGYFLDELRQGVDGSSYDLNQRPYCFDTNLEDIAEGYYPYLVNYGRNSSGNMVKSDTLKLEVKTDGSVVDQTSGGPFTEGFSLGIKKLTNGSEAELVVTSTYAYGITGRNSSDHKPSIAPYTPLRFHIRVVKVENAKTTTTTAAIVQPPLLLRKN